VDFELKEMGINLNPATNDPSAPRKKEQIDEFRRYFLNKIKDKIMI
jgi:hypothetical protein